MTIETKTIKALIVISIVMLISGFLIGRCSNTNEVIAKTEEVVKYVSSPYPVYDTIYKPEPYEVVRLEVKNQRDTIYLTQQVDTTKILEDYFLTRRYALDFSNDTIGVFKVNTEVHKNELISAESFIQPKYKTIIRENTVYKVPLLQFYTSIGSSIDFKTNKLSIGVDLKQRYLIGLSGIRHDNKFIYTIDLGIKW